MRVRKGDAQYTCHGVKVYLPLCSTFLRESRGERTRHSAVLLDLSETGGNFSSHQRVTPGESIAVILHPDVRYAVRGRVTWTRLMDDATSFNFGVVFEEGIPDSLWDVLGRSLVA